MSHIRMTLAAALLAAAFGSQASAAGVFGSSYSSTKAVNCWGINGEKQVDDNTTRVCRGKVGLVVFVNEGETRETISVGRDKAQAGNEPAAQAWFGPSSAALRTIEWRMGGSVPFAIIQRWQLADKSETDGDGRPATRPMLVVTRLPPGPVCHVAYVDVAANPNADELARQAADELARNFKCGTDQVKVIGTSGRAVELAQQH
ncbi:hypothetical protein [Bradyrhizobium sp.]|uniref:hypothetical protein n=1 Tax=Bradyrhizobium sp. TaxID=376 RepID=UPI001D8EE274|nr:hypothetical protein [Bradyrhizobium sp.]MBV8701063.1 hypothetical protein [Bradyrhizobium sp.]MBV8918771.1 hypothetical protein [Bradyrhizobium sp.]MBV9985956.1 hypothetical protein [Bradyrhizobium sp.]